MPRSRSRFLASVSLVTILPLLSNGCTSSPPVVTATASESQVDLRMLVVDGLPKSVATKFAGESAPNPGETAKGQVQVLTKSEMARVESSLVDDRQSVLSAPRILTRSGQPSSISCDSSPGVGFEIGVVPAIQPCGTITLSIQYTERPAGFASRTVQTSLRRGETVAVLIPNATNDAFRTLFVTPRSMPDRVSAATAR